MGLSSSDRAIRRRLLSYRISCLEHQRDGEAVSIGDAFGLSEEFYAVCDVAPLVSAADLQLYIVIVIEHLEVDGLEDLVREFREGNARIQSGCDDILGQHRVDIEKLAGAEYEPGCPLPWKHLDMGFKEAYLIKEWENAKAQRFTPMCFDGCKRCGVCEE